MNNRCEESINGDVSLEMCCNTIGKGWGSPCEECPPRKGGKRYFVLVASSCTSWSQSLGIPLRHLHSFLSFLYSFIIFLPLVIVQHVGLMHKQIGSVLQILT